MSRLREVAVPLCIMLAIGSMVIPLSPSILDTLLVSNLLLAFILLLNAVYVRDPLQLSSLPTLLLLSTLFRLGLNISTTRLILSGADAGRIVDAFGHVVIQGSLIVGIVVFMVVTLIQFIVIAKGAERVAEVAARFTLDGLPGRQMSIDADVRAGLLDFEQAREKRVDLQTESRFYGALDGAMKFIKGDAIAGLAIVGVNLIGGLAVGLIVHGLPIGEALQRYSLLTVGDGLVSQIPALLNSLAAGLVVTRVTRGDGSSLAHDLMHQLGEGRLARGGLGLVTFGAAFAPGMPTVPLLVVALVTLASLIRGPQKQHLAPGLRAPIALRMPCLVSFDLQEGWEAPKIEELQARVRTELFDRCGILLPKIDVRLRAARSRVLLREQPIASFVLGTDLSEASEAISAALIGHAVELIDDQHTRRLLELHEEHHPDAVSCLVPALMSVSQLTEVVRQLVEEGVSLRSFDLILQGCAIGISKQLSGRDLVQEVRIVMRRSIIGPWIDDEHTVTIAALDPQLDIALAKGKLGPGAGDADSIGVLVRELQDTPGPVLVGCSKLSRRLLFECFRAARVKATVVAYDEIPETVLVRTSRILGSGRADDSEREVAYATAA